MIAKDRKTDGQRDRKKWNVLITSFITSQSLAGRLSPAHPPILGCWITAAHIWPGQWSGQDCFAKVITSSSLFAIVIYVNDDEGYNCDDFRQVTLNTWHKVRFIRSGLEASLQVGKTTTNKTNTTITTLPNQPRNNLHNRSHQHTTTITTTQSITPPTSKQNH